MKSWYWFTKKYAPPEIRPTANLAPASKLLPVSGFTSTLGTMLPTVAGPAKSISSRFGWR